MKRKKEKLQQKLFENMSFFVDSAWDVDPYRKEIELLSDKLFPQDIGRKITFSKANRLFKKMSEGDGNVIASILDADKLKKLDGTLSYVTEPFFANGTIHTLRVVITPEQDEEGKNSHVYVAIQDNSHQYQQKKMLEEMQMINLALSQDYANVYIVNPEDESIEVRKQDGFVVEETEKGEIMKMPYLEAWKRYVDSCAHPEDKEELMRAGALKRVLTEIEKKGEYVCNYRTINQGLRYFQFKYLKMEDGRIVAGYRNIDNEIKQEIEQRKVIEKALAAEEHANVSKTVFLNNMSHDIRTPMNAIIGFTQLAEEHLSEEERVRDYLEKIKTSSNHLLDLINDVLDMSRIESGNIKIKEKPTSLVDLMQDIQNIVRPDLEKKNLKFETCLDGIVTPFVVCDRLRLKQAIINCLSNAIKFTPENGTVGIRVEQGSCCLEDYASFDFYISDTGIGMSDDFAAHIFEPFTRENTATVSGIQGTGLGMAITKNIVDMMGGTIKVYSEKDKGSTFKISLAFAISNADEVIEIDKAKEFDLSHKNLCDRKILLVEDNELNREIAKEILEEQGAIIETAVDGYIAVDMIENAEAGKYDLVLMDIQMPIMDGYAATRKIRALEDRNKATIPIIAMTANAFEEDRKAAFEAGMDAHVAKPIEIRKLITSINSVLKSND